MGACAGELELDDRDTGQEADQRVQGQPATKLHDPVDRPWRGDGNREKRRRSDDQRYGHRQAGVVHGKQHEVEDQ